MLQFGAVRRRRRPHGAASRVVAVGRAAHGGVSRVVVVEARARSAHAVARPQMRARPQVDGDQHDSQELLVLACVDEDVDGGVDDQGQVVDVHQELDPLGPDQQLPVHGHLQALVGVDDGSDEVAGDEDDDDDDEHHGDAVVPALVGRDGVVPPRGLGDRAVDEGVQDDQDGEGDEAERERVDQEHVVAAVARVTPQLCRPHFREKSAKCKNKSIII